MLINFVEYFAAAVIALSPIQDAGSTDPRPKAWNAMVTKLAALPKGEQLRQVNTYFNRKPYVFAVTLTGRPLADVVASGGNCVDFSKAKRQMLLDLGWQSNELVEITFVRPGGQYGHRTLIARAYGAYIVLDLKRDEPVLAANYFLPDDRLLFL